LPPHEFDAKPFPNNNADGSGLNATKLQSPNYHAAITPNADTVSSVSLKELAHQMPVGSIARDAILALPDILPRNEAAAMMKIIVHLLYREVKGK